MVGGGGGVDFGPYPLPPQAAPFKHLFLFLGLLWQVCLKEVCG